MDKHDQQLPKCGPVLGSIVSRNCIFLNKKKSTSTQEEQGISDSLVTIFCIGKAENMFLLHEYTSDANYKAKS